ncbi:serine--tRNA synthetase-like protein Slimp [Odontomachus brunneus]|uniref:serine--tRNA synthetase-like protein Slimp n=1 Tax=Odontomachus brunneus TaxID=486640 RepID=UPI0013F2513C|nr:serine--tRNA synthetase-like protein Slimp [Odontomachus brunneus]
MHALVKFTRCLRLHNLAKSSLSHIRRKAIIVSCCERHYSSALFISGKIAHKVFAYLTPHLDVDERFADIEKLQEEITLRRMEVNVVQLRDLWEFYRKMNTDLRMLEDHLKEIKDSKKQLIKSGVHTPEIEQEFNKLQMQQQVIKQDIKTMKQAIWELDDNVVQKILKLPNNLDPRTPTVESIVLRNVGNAPDSSEADGRTHIEIGTRLGLLKYENPMLYYLCNKAALFELGVLAHASRVLGDGNNMLRMSGADFSRSLVVEGSGLDHEDPMTAFLIENHDEVERGSSNRMHLTGGASLTSFLTLHTKQLINPNNFPLKYFATGRQYTPLPANSPPCGLFTTCQASVAHVFVMVKDGKDDDYRILFDELVDKVCQLYDDLCIDHYRVVMKSAPQLNTWESLRVSFEVWSPFAKQYIEVGHLSACGDYFSKRLLINYQTPSGGSFPAALTGTVLSVPRLIGCMLEQNPHEFVIPPKIAELIP